MDSYQGDLTDILRAGGGPIEGEGKSSGEGPVRNWQFQPVPDGSYPKANCNDFGDPFCHVKDPLVDELNMTNKSTFFNNSTDVTKPSFVFSPKVRPPGNVFSKMLQISPNTKFSTIIGDAINSPSSSNTCSVESSLGLQISSPQNTGIKRRKSQAKKVVCIPATSPVNSRAGGEVVPSDLWAWRKYGQKPIKGSPYPRGYYRCSSSKGCSARKQVERSRTEPNMLVITYTSEHNHPWPTQRNALAGSTRSQPSKGTSSPKAEKEPLLATNLINMKEEPNTDDRGGTSTSLGHFLVPPPEELNTIETNFSISSPKVTSNNPCVKEEREDFDSKNSPMEMNDDNTTYRPLLPPDMTSNIHSDDFFAELGEIGDDDPLNMFFSTIPGFQADHHEERDNNKALDDFPSFFDWIGISNTNNDPSFEDVKKEL